MNRIRLTREEAIEFIKIDISRLWNNHIVIIVDKNCIGLKTQESEE